MRRIHAEARPDGRRRTAVNTTLTSHWLLRSPRNGNYDRQTVVSAAVEIFNHHGFDATSMGLVADLLGVTRGALYHHVPSKGELLRQALEPIVAELDDIVRETDRRRESSSLERLDIVLRKVIAVFIDHLSAATLLLRLRGNTETERQALLSYRAVEQKLHDLVLSCTVEGSLKKEINPEVAAHYLIGMVASITDWYGSKAAPSEPQLAEHILVLSFRGLKSP